jgi:4-amino-4-deoxy-L-arabinose transferase-like glycosyltransferase
MKRTLLAALVVLSIALRALFWLEIVGPRAPLRGDEIDYHAIARSIASGDGFCAGGVPTAARPPLYPVLLGTIYRITGAQEAAGRVLQILLGGAIVLLTYILARKLFSEGVALLAAALVAASPSLVFMSAYLLTENLYVALLLVFLILCSGMGERKLPYGLCAAGGIVLGLASLTRPNGFLFALFAAAAIALFGAGEARGRLMRSIVVIAAVVATLVPWAARNEARFGKTVPFTTSGGITFYQGNNRVVSDVPSYHGTVSPLEALPGWNEIKGKGEIARDEEAWRLGKAFVRENPRLAAKMAAWRFSRFWRLTGDAGFSGVKSGWWWDRKSRLGGLASSLDVVFVFSIIVMPLFLLGIALTLRRARSLVFLYGIILTHTATALIFFGSLRSRMPIEPVIAILGAAGAVSIFGAIRHHFGD